MVKSMFLKRSPWWTKRRIFRSQEKQWGNGNSNRAGKGGEERPWIVVNIKALFSPLRRQVRLTVWFSVHSQGQEKSRRDTEKSPPYFQRLPWAWVERLT